MFYINQRLMRKVREYRHFGIIVLFWARPAPGLAMPRAPTIDPKRDAEIARLRKLLAEVERIHANRRADECADERGATIRAMLQDLGATA